jgi:sortase A
MKKLGILFIVIGLTYSLYNLYPWLQARSSATSLSEQEQKAYQSIQTDKMTEAAEATENENSAKEKTVPSYKKGQEVAELIIPRMNKKYPVYWGTDEESLKKGVGMYTDKRYTVTPGEKGHVVLSGHRDTVFDGLDVLRAGDELGVKIETQTYWYEIEKHWITDKNDRSVIVPTKREQLTLTSCYPFDYLGNAPDRYIIQARKIQHTHY